MATIQSISIKQVAEFVLERSSLFATESGERKYPLHKTIGNSFLLECFVALGINKEKADELITELDALSMAFTDINVVMSILNAARQETNN